MEQNCQENIPASLLPWKLSLSVCLIHFCHCTVSPCREASFLHVIHCWIIWSHRWLWPQHSTQVLPDTTKQTSWFLITAFDWVPTREAPSWRLNCDHAVLAIKRSLVYSGLYEAVKFHLVFELHYCIALHSSSTVYTSIVFHSTCTASLGWPISPLPPSSFS